MYRSNAHIPTERAGRYLVQLCRHSSEMGRMHRIPAGHGIGRMPQIDHVEWSADRGTIRFAGGTCELRATPDALRLHLDANDEPNLAELQRGLANRVATIGRREGLTVTWRRAADPVPTAAVESPAPATPPHRRRRGALPAIVGAAVVVLVLGVHFGIGGAVLALSPAAWAGGATVAVLGVVVVVVLAHVLAGGAAMGGARWLTHAGRKHRRPRASAGSSSADTAG